MAEARKQDERPKAHRFKAEVRKLLDLVIHSLYSNKEIFLRELISNASDAAEKLRFEALRDDGLYEGNADLCIRIECDREARTITISDNGIGMSREEVSDNLGTLAGSGTRKFLEAMEQQDAGNLVGRFGVGFYSAFVVADEVTVETRRAGLLRSEGVRWHSRGEGGYSVTALDKPKRGTRVILHLREGEDSDAFLDEARLRAIVQKYSDHIAFPILMQGGNGESGEQAVNQATALWSRNKKDVAEEEYKEFYTHLTHDLEAPLRHVHARVEGTTEYTCLLYLPAHAALLPWEQGERRGVRLYVQRVFILDDVGLLLPPWLRFVRGVVSCDDLPLNVSRELLQENRALNVIRNGCARRILDLLQDVAANHAEDYLAFWRNFGRELKEGLLAESSFHDDLLGLARFASTRAGGDGVVSLEDYVAGMQPEQEAIYFLPTADAEAGRGSPLLESFHEHDLEVLLADPLDELAFGRMRNYQGKSLVSVATEGLTLPGETADAETGDNDREQADDAPLAELARKMQDKLGEQVRDVRPSRRLRESASCLVYGEHQPSAHLRRALESSGHRLPGQLPLLEINPRHPLVQQLQTVEDEQRFGDWCLLLYEQAALGEGLPLKDPTGFVQRLNRLLLAMAGASTAS